MKWRRLAGLLPLLAVAGWPGPPVPAAEEIQALLVRPGWRAEPIPGGALAGLDAETGAVALWLWSRESAPVRLPMPARPPVSLEPAAEWLEVVLTTPPDAARAPERRVIAAPVAMWREVPEGLLPSWPVPEDGRLRLPRPEEPWRVRPVGGGLGGGWSEAAAGTRRLVLAMRPAPDRAVRIEDPAGEPVPGLAVQLFVRGVGATPERIAVYGSDDSGTLRLPGLPGEVEVELLAIGDDHPPLRFEGRVADLPAALRMEAGTVLSGRLVDEAGKPVSGARVTLLAFPAPGAKVVARGATSDAGGAWRIPGAAPGPAQLAAVAEGFARMNRTLEIEPAAVRDLGGLTMTRGREATVRVVDAEGHGVVGAEIVTRGGHRAAADARGLAGIAGLPPGAVEATVTAPGFLPGSVRLDPAEGDVNQVVLTRAVLFSGRLVDAEGTPVEGGRATVEIGARTEAREIEPDGRFAVEVPPRTPASLALASATTVTVLRTLAPAEPGEEIDLGDLAVPPGVAVTGRLVRSEDATPVAGARVWTVRSAHDPLFAWTQGDLLEARSDNGGGFRLRGLAPGPALLRIDGPGLARRFVEVALAAGEPSHDLGEVVLDRGCEVTVETGDDGAVGLLARLDLRSAWLESDMLTASVHGGRAVFAGVPAGRATVSLVRGHELVCDREIEVGEGEESLTVECGPDRGRVRGVVLAGEQPAGPGHLVWSLDGFRPPGVILKQRAGELTNDQVLWGGRPDARVEVDATGWFETTALRAGEWQVAWAPEGGVQQARRLSVSLAEADEQEVMLRFPLLALRGRVLDGEGRGVGEARVVEIDQSAFTLSAADGSFRLEGLEPGALRLQARRGDASSEILTLEVASGDVPEPVDLELIERRQAVTVEVVDAEGSPIPGALVFLEEEGGAVRLVTTDLAGRSSLPYHPPLPRRLRAGAFAGGAWSLGGWLDFDLALDGVSLRLAATGGAEITCEDACGALGLRSANGWDLAALHLRLGRRLAVSAGEPLALGGLPAGRYLATVGGAEAAFSVEEGRSRELRLP